MKQIAKFFLVAIIILLLLAACSNRLPAIDPAPAILSTTETSTQTALIPISTLTSTSTTEDSSTITVNVDWLSYTNTVYGFSFSYPPSWELIEQSPNFIRLYYGNAAHSSTSDQLWLTVGFRKIDEDVRTMRTGVGAGDIVSMGTVTFLGEQISRDVLIYEGKVKAVLYNMAEEIPAGDLMLTLSLDQFSQDYESIDFPQDVQDEIDRVVESFELSTESAATSGPTADPIPTQSPAAALSTPMVVPVVLATPANPPEPVLPLGEDLEVLYIHDNQLIRSVTGVDSYEEVVADQPDNGEVNAALRVAEVVYLLRGNELQKVDLMTGTTETIAAFDVPVLFGQLMSAPDGSKLVVSVYQNDPGGTEEDKRSLGVYEPLPQGDYREILAEQIDMVGFYRPLGFTPNGDELYLFPLGGDASLVDLWQVNLQTGAVEVHPGGYGEAISALSPDARYLATRILEIDPNDSSRAEYGIGFYDLTAEPVSTRFLMMKDSNSYPQWLFWSADGEDLYVYLLDGQPGDVPENSHGLWRFDPVNEEFTYAADIDTPVTYLGLSADGEWALFDLWQEDGLLGVHLETGASMRVDLPDGEVIIVN